MIGPELLQVDSLRVLKDERLAGWLYRTEDGSRFEFEGDFEGDLALTIPRSLNTVETTGDNLPPFLPRPIAQNADADRGARRQPALS